MKKFDAIIIGSGQGGTPLAKKLAKSGLKTAIIEKRWIGGTCINDGCTPTKAMLASAKRAFLVRNGKELGIESNGCTVNFSRIIARKNEIVQSFRDAAHRGLTDTTHLSVIFGEAVFTGKKIISVSLSNGEKETITADKIFINTGTTPKLPELEGLDQVLYYTSTSLMEIEVLPDHLIILGGGYIALEFAQMFRRLGSKVTIIEQDASLLKREDQDVAECLRNVLEEEDIKIHTATTAEKISVPHPGTVSLVINSSIKSETIEGSHLLIAIGRSPQTTALQLDKTGVLTDPKGFINVDEYLETSMPGIYAMGDVNGGPAFTHISYNDYIILLKNILEDARISVKGRQVPYTIFTDPQLGRVGLTEKEAKIKGFNTRAVTLSMDKVARGIETGETRGMMKAIVDTETKLILGVAILAAEGGEIMSVLQMAMMGNVTYPQVRETIFAHPLYSESLNNLFMSLDSNLPL
ncbi:MAG: mercuric reductase [Chitinophagaceae bacterium]